MNIKNLIISVLFTVFAQNILAATNEAECRQTVVDSYRTFGIIIRTDSFSSARFEDMELTAEQFNALELDVQILIYRQVKPLEVVAQETIDILNSKISRISGSSVEYLMLDALTKWRALRESLRLNCF